MVYVNGHAKKAIKRLADEQKNMKAKKPEVLPKFDGLGIKTDAIRALDERASYTERIVADIESTRAKLFSNLPAFQIPMRNANAREMNAAKMEPKNAEIQRATTDLSFSASIIPPKAKHTEKTQD